MGGSACIAAHCCYVKRKEDGWLGAVYLLLYTVMYDHVQLMGERRLSGGVHYCGAPAAHRALGLLTPPLLPPNTRTHGWWGENGLGPPGTP